MRAAFEAARKFKGHPPGEVRDALVSETAARGISDLTPEQLDLLTDAVLKGPRRAFLTTARSGLIAVRAFFREMRAHSVPSWTNSPKKAPRLELRDDQDVVRAVVELDPTAAPVVTRLFEEVPKLWTDTEDSDEPAPRIFSCWVDVGPTDQAAGTLTVHVGKHVLGRLRAEDSVVVREVLAAGRHAAVEFDAGAVDGEPRYIDVGLPDRV